MLRWLKLDHLLVFKRLNAIANRDGRIIWRSDQHALRWLLPWASGLLAMVAHAFIISARTRRANVVPIA